MSEEVNVPQLTGDHTKVFAANCNITKLQELPPNIFTVAHEILELNLGDNNISNESLGALALFTKLESLILDNNPISSIEAFPPLPNLHTLWMNNNRLSDAEETLTVLYHKCPRLTYLSLMRNPCAPSELTGNMLVEYNRYRIYVKYKLPSLRYFDMLPYTPQEEQDAKERGQFMQTRTAKRTTTSSSSPAENTKPTLDTAAVTATATTATGGSPGTPKRIMSPVDSAGIRSWPESDFVGEQDYFLLFWSKKPEERKHQTYFTQQRHFYSGKSSEGNRFIRDDVL